MSELYLCHLARPVCDHRPARHYLGFSENAAKREQDYRAMRVGYHGRLMLAAVERGIDFVIARVWKSADKRDEKLLRDLHANPRLCPICNPSLELETRLNAAGRYQTYRLGDPKRVRYGDLAALRGRVLRPARPRVRQDGTSNQPEPIEVSEADRDFLDAMQRGYLDIAAAFGVPAELIRPIDDTYADYGFDADIAF